MIQAEAEFADYTATNQHPQRGIKGNIMFGHGKTQDVFEKRDFVTTNDLVYEKRQKVEKIIDPHSFESDFGKSRSTMQINGQQNDLPTMFGKSGTAAGETVAKHYNQFTGKYDNNSLKMNLRGVSDLKM